MIDPVIVPTSGMSENRNAMKASRAVYSIGPMMKPSTVRKRNVQNTVGEAQQHLAEHVPADRGRDLLGDVDEGLALARRHQLVDAALEGRERGDEVEGEDQHDDGAEDAGADREHALRTRRR